jgi:hypothetical protein
MRLCGLALCPGLVFQWRLWLQLNSRPDFINALKAAHNFAESVSQELGMQVGANGL